MGADAELVLEVVSPMFIGGAEPRAGDPAAEGLRVPSLRGALRYWFRALLGAPSLDVLAPEEAALFGSAERPSPLVLRIEPLGRVRAVSWDAVKREGGPPLRVSGGASGFQASGIGYLGDVALRQTRGDLPRRALPAGVRYRAVLRWRRRTPPGPEERDRLAATLWLLSRLGALGTRARRGFGAIQVAAVQAPGFLEGSLRTLPLPVGARSPAELVEELERGGQQIRRLRLASGPVGDYPNLSVCEVRVLDGRAFRGWAEALEYVGGQYRAFRMQRPLARRIPFGLPIPQRGGGPPPVDGLKRRASPLRFRPVKLATGDCALLVVLFEDRLFPRTDADHSVLRSFLGSLGGRPIRFS